MGRPKNKKTRLPTWYTMYMCTDTCQWRCTLDEFAAADARAGELSCPGACCYNCFSRRRSWRSLLRVRQAAWSHWTWKLDLEGVDAKQHTLCVQCNGCTGKVKWPSPRIMHVSKVCCLSYCGLLQHSPAHAWSIRSTSVACFVCTRALCVLLAAENYLCIAGACLSSCANGGAGSPTLVC